eukprot:s2635_g5.t1
MRCKMGLKAHWSFGAIPLGNGPDRPGPLPGLSGLGGQLAATAGHSLVTWNCVGFRSHGVMDDHDVVLNAFGDPHFKEPPCGQCINYDMIEGSSEVKLPTIWTDGKAKMGRSSQKEKVSQKREDPRAKSKEKVKVRREKIHVHEEALRDLQGDVHRIGPEHCWAAERCISAGDLR